MALTAKRPSTADDNRMRLMQEVAGDSGKKRRLNTEIEESLHKKIKVRAAEEGKTISEITRSLWIEYLKK